MPKLGKFHFFLQPYFHFIKEKVLLSLFIAFVINDTVFDEKNKNIGQKKLNGLMFKGFDENLLAKSSFLWLKAQQQGHLTRRMLYLNDLKII